MVKPLTFKGDKKPKKRKHNEIARATDDEEPARRAHVDTSEDDSWTMPADAGELTGPTVIVLPTSPPTCLASDPNGNIYASQLENMVEGDAKTAEPHNVQQVWVASRVSGMAANEISFKASHGGYLSCDQYGILGAKREARGNEERFIIDTTTDDGERFRYQLRTSVVSPGSTLEQANYISASTEQSNLQKEENNASEKPQKKVSISLRGDGNQLSRSTYLILRMQLRFKPKTPASKEAERVKEKISRQQLESDAGRKLTDEEAKRLKRAKKEGNYQESILDVRAKGKHDKYA